jgi:hypothetical protein
MTAEEYSLLLLSPRADVRELALRAQSRLLAQPITAAERWLERVQAAGKGELDQFNSGDAQRVHVCVQAGNGPYGEWEACWEGAVFPGYFFPEDGSLLWKGLFVWRKAVLLAGTGAADPKALWYSGEPVVLRLASEEEIDVE